MIQLHIIEEKGESVLTGEEVLRRGAEVSVGLLQELQSVVY